MTETLGPAERKLIKHLDHQLDVVIEDVHAGKQDMGRLFYIAQQLSLLSSNKHVPSAVKERLRAALLELQMEPGHQPNVAGLIHAKEEIADISWNVEFGVILKEFGDFFSRKGSAKIVTLHFIASIKAEKC